MKTCSIYGLFDTRINEFFYIGSSVNPAARFGNHMSLKGVAAGVKAIIEEMLADGMKPDLRIIEEVPTEDRRQWEQHYIEYYRKRGHRLVNKRAVWGKTAQKVVNFGFAIYETQAIEINRRADELGIPRAELIRTMLDFALKNMT